MLGGHVGELELDRLVLGDRLAERLALAGVRDASSNARRATPTAAGSDVDATDLDAASSA